MRQLWSAVHVTPSLEQHTFASKLSCDLKFVRACSIGRRFMRCGLATVSSKLVETLVARCVVARVFNHSKKFEALDHQRGLEVRRMRQTICDVCSSRETRCITPQAKKSKNTNAFQWRRELAQHLPGKSSTWPVVIGSLARRRGLANPKSHERPGRSGPMHIFSKRRARATFTQPHLACSGLP